MACLLSASGLGGSRVVEAAPLRVFHDWVPHAGLLVLPDSDTVTLSRTPLPAELASITTDTGALAPGHHDFSRYTTPGLCEMAAFTTTEVLRNALPTLLSYDTLQYHRATDTMPGQAVAETRTCMARFTLATVPAQEWEFLFHLAIISGNDTLALATLDSLVAAEEPAFRAQMKLMALRIFLGKVTDGFYTMRGGKSASYGFNRAEPARPALARALVARMDQEGDLSTSLQAHAELEEYYDNAEDLSHALAEARQINTLAHRVGGGEDQTAKRAGVQLLGVYSGLMRLVYFSMSDSIPVVARLAQQALQGVPTDAVCGRWMPNCRTASVADVEARLTGEGHLLRSMSWLSNYWDEWVGKPVTPLHLAFWFPPTYRSGNVPKAVPDTEFTSSSGRLTLLVAPNPKCQVSPTYLLGFNVCHGLPETLRRLVQRFGSQLSIVLIAAPRGTAFLGGGDTTVTEEAERIRWYFQDLEQFPVAVAVQRPTLPRLPDGRYLPTYLDPTYFLQMETGPDLATAKGEHVDGGVFEIVDRTGIVRFVTSMGDGYTDMPEVDQVLAHLLQQTPPASSSSASSLRSSTP